MQNEYMIHKTPRPGDKLIRKNGRVVTVPKKRRRPTRKGIGIILEDGTYLRRLNGQWVLDRRTDVS